jgi:hypothetical protein
MRPHGNPKELEKRRRNAITLLKKGKASLSAVARWLGASKSSVSQWPAPQGGSRAAGKALPKTERRFGQVAAGRAAFVRISNRSLDAPAGGSGNSEGIWHSISSPPRLAVAFGDGVELSKTGMSGFTAERGRDCPLEAPPLAAYKKTPKDLAPRCSSWMDGENCVVKITFLLDAAFQGGPRPFSVLFFPACIGAS